jgi:hypothetical protein
MNELLKKLKDIHSDCCVTIILNTHRTKPDNQKDSIVLKNLIKEAENRLHNDFDKRFAGKIAERIKELAENIKHNFNLESLVLFVSEDIAEYTRLTIPVENRVVIDSTFATRDLVRALHEQTSYYVLVISRQNARLIEAHNDKVVREFSDPFPIKNETLFTKDKLKLSTAKGQDNLIEEFFNWVDKVLNRTIAQNPLPVLLVTEERNYHHYLKVADNKGNVIGHLNKNRDDEKAHHIVSEAWKIVNEIIIKKNSERMAELKKAVSSKNFVSNFTDIWNAIKSGRGKTLFVKKGYFQPAKIENNKVVLVDEENSNDKDVIDDIIDEMIEQNLSYGGDTVFIKGDDLKEFGGLALTLRY